MGNGAQLTNWHIGIAPLTQKNIQLFFIVTLLPENTGYFSGVLLPETSSSEAKQKEVCSDPVLSVEEIV